MPAAVFRFSLLANLINCKQKLVLTGRKEKLKFTLDISVITDGLQEVPYLSRLDGNQLQPGQSLIARGYITGDLIRDDEAGIWIMKGENTTVSVNRQWFWRGSLTEVSSFPGSEGFIVNLTSGPNVELDEDETGELDDRLLALRVDLTKGKVFLNACINGQWGKEAFVKQSYKEGDEFDIRIRCFEQHFEIYVEHKLIANFKHYVPMSNISHIYVTGDVRLYAVSWEGKLYVGRGPTHQFIWLLSEHAVHCGHPRQFLRR